MISMVLWHSIIPVRSRIAGNRNGNRTYGSTSSMSHPAFGGIVGENEVAGTISGCSSGVNISISMTATDSYVGGIAGVNIGTIEKCVAGGNLSVTQANGNSYQVYLGALPAGSNSLETWADM